MKVFSIIITLLMFFSYGNSQNPESNNNFHQVLTKRTGPIHMLWDELLQKHVSEDGRVDYKSFKNEHDKLLGHISVMGRLQADQRFKTFSSDFKLAYWINLYNALTVDLILRNYPVKSIKDIERPWKQRLWKQFNIDFNLDEIEHQIIRKMNEPRIHFALVCAAQSCPKLYNKAFTEDNLDSTLTTLTKTFLADPSKNNISEKRIKLSKIFKWFTKDFKTNGTLIDFLNKYTEVSISEHAKTSYLDYNWNLNE